MKIVSSKRMGFRSLPLHAKREPSAFSFLTQRASFWIASFSVIAYVAGNMVGQHGWHVFWKSVLGKGDDSSIVYTGTVSPIALVPDYRLWATYGGDPKEHSYRQVPQDVLVPLPPYDSGAESRGEGETWSVYSVAHLGSYVTGVKGSGSHPGVDIRVPEGTPVRAIANGIVAEVTEDAGFGKVLVIRHPNVPDPDDPGRETTLYSIFAHLSAILVSEGSPVQKGEEVALSGRTGYVTGPHLHFQIDREDAPWHPYWPFSSEEAQKLGMTFDQAVNAGLFRSRGLLYTVDPMLYVQANHLRPAPTTIAASSMEERQEQGAPREESWFERVQRLRAERLALRFSRRSAVEKHLRPLTASTVLRRETLVSASTTDDADILPMVIAEQQSQNVVTVDVQHDGSFAGRGWEALRIVLQDKDGTVVTTPVIDRDLILRTAYGEAEFRPSALSPLDFHDGVAEVQMLPRGRRTVVIQVLPFSDLSRPMRYEE